MNNITSQYQYSEYDKQAMVQRVAEAEELRDRLNEQEAETSTVNVHQLLNRVELLERELRRTNDRLRLTEEEVVRLRSLRTR